MVSHHIALAPAAIHSHSSGETGKSGFTCLPLKVIADVQQYAGTENVLYY